MRRMLEGMTVAALALGLAACEARDDAEDTTMTGDVDTMAQSAADTMTQQQEGMGERMQLQLEAVNNSGASGQVDITPADGRTTIILTLDAGEAGGEDGQRHMAHIHAGTCANIGQAVAPLEAIATVSARGSSTTLLGQDIHTIADGNHVIAAHAAGGNPGQPIACVPIPAHVGNDTTQTAM